MYRLLYVGDLNSDIGSSIVNKKIYEGFGFRKSNISSIYKKYSAIYIFKCVYRSSIIHCGELSLLSTLVMVLSFFLRKKTILTLHAGIFLSRNMTDYPSRTIFFEFLHLRLSSKVVVPSEIYLSRMLKSRYYVFFSNKYVVIGNPVDEITNSGIEKEKFKVVTIGGGRKEKGIINICKAISMIDFSDCIELHVVGRDGPDTYDILKYDFVYYHGLLSRDNLLDIMRGSSVFIQNSYFETFSIAAIEAYQMKCKVILSNNVGALDLFSSSHDFTASPDDIVGLSAIIRRFFNTNVHQYLDLELVSKKSVINKYNSIWFG
ncbi:glycosyltransferase family 4 protein [Vibrio splendidus]|uniref:glycosyltransferase family 4 protein n=1 Tax=Vibrio splendidus TaxID=29497 RepID=UPI000E32C270|nr:glycosyltransferase family 4 protein [Vibrio splendidus]